MKKSIYLFTLFLFLLTLCSCSRNVRTTEKLILAIGTVSSESGDAIAAARSAFDALSEAEKMRVSHRFLLEDAETAYFLVQFQSISTQLRALCADCDLATDTELTLWSAANEQTPVYPSQAGITDIISELLTFSEAYYSLKRTNTILKETIRDFRTQYAVSHPEETALLVDWYVNTSLYADLAIQPNGSLAAFEDQISACRRHADYYSKLADTYE